MAPSRQAVVFSTSLHMTHGATPAGKAIADAARQALPNRRCAETFDFEHAGHQFSLTVGRFSDGRPAEIFLSSKHVGSPLEAIARDAAVTVSIALQYGSPLATIASALTKDHDGGPATLLGAAIDTLLDRSQP
jgi:hypothetical protein